MRQIQIILLLLGLFFSIAAADAPPVFCKCTCFKNSTIIRLGPKHADVSRLELEKRTASTSCKKCNKSFCRDEQQITICKDATDDDIQTMCFQRDSNKDKIIVWGFILGTTSLLGWAAFKNLAERRAGKNTPAGGRGQYGRVGETPSRGPQQ